MIGRGFVAGAVLVGVMVLAALAATAIATNDPARQFLRLPVRAADAAARRRRVRRVCARRSSTRSASRIASSGATPRIDRGR